MKPICFSCNAQLPLKPEEICEQILELSNWPDFQGYGPLPGIQQAEFRCKTEEIVGSQIRVLNRDGSSHTEEIVRWEPTQCIQLRLHEFSAPLSKWASHFDETWFFSPQDSVTHVRRTMNLHPITWRGKVVLWLVSGLLRRALQRHLRSVA